VNCSVLLLRRAIFAAQAFFQAAQRKEHCLYGKSEELILLKHFVVFVILH
jgi:hypothetical protein